MLIEFLTGECPGRAAAQDHIKSVYRDVYGAQVSAFSPLLVVAKRVDGKILCAAGIRTAQNGFFSDTYLGTDFSSALRRAANLDVPAGNIMEVVSLASITPFPVLPMLDRMIGWGRENGMTCGVFTATAPLRRLLRRTGLGYVELAPAKVSMVSNPQDWGHYYDTDPRVCAFNDVLTNPVYLSPRAVPVAAEAS
ncbi:thermostable hemolysin [Rhodobacteraceae bacterium KMM 6894]|nr:thermostable hemolysin [Rhodobacteraceae bacterium KMM 6894]